MNQVAKYNVPVSAQRVYDRK